MAKILIVDDSQIYRFKLRKLVEARGHDAVTARDGEEALALARAEQPQIILMDIIMPGMSGYQVKRQLARDAATRHIPVIFVSSRTADSDRIWGMRLGAAAYMTKPVTGEALGSAIEEFLAA